MTDDHEHDHADHDHDEHEGHEHSHEDAHEHHEHVWMEYPDAVAAFREDKDEYFKTGAGSPIPAEGRDAFTGLPYYAVDEALRFPGLTLQAYTGDEPSHFQIPTSDGKLRP